MIKKDINIKNSSALVLGITFKENCPDVRNTKSVDVIKSLKSYGIETSVYDPWANEKEVKNEYGIESSRQIPKKRFDAIVLTVAHNEFKNIDFSDITNKFNVVYDVKNILPKSLTDWTL